ncbi:tandem-95 repeat protein [Candidatus Woesearchaeota archaeon]|nr:tandem-95 repeat protein [Candidatus Woesearchaeota archaeon]
MMLFICSSISFGESENTVLATGDETLPGEDEPSAEQPALDQHTQADTEETEMAQTLDQKSMTLPYVYDPAVPQQGKLESSSMFKTSLYTGAAIYSYTINVPPGINGLEPQVSISYNHQNTENGGFLGRGWSLSQNYVDRDVHYTSENISDDTYRLVFDGQSYDLVYDSSNGTYHTKIESFIHITKEFGGMNEKKEYWKVETKNGNNYRFGFNYDSELLSNQHNFVWRWSLDLINDTHGNSIFYTYQENPHPSDIGAVYPSLIEYNNNKERKIQFIFESNNRPDLTTIYDDGNKVSYSRRLKDIILFINSDLVMRYTLSYSSFNYSSESFVSRITQYGNDNSTALPATTFSYVQTNNGWFENDSWEPPLCYTNREGVDFGARFLDLNGDGLTDILYGRDLNSCSGEDRKAWLNTGFGWLENDSWEPPLCYSNREGVDFGARFLDLNGDGLPDVLYGRDLNSCSGDDRKAWLNTGYGWLENDSWEPPLCYTNREGVDFGARFLDLNGDGLTDILYSRDLNSCNGDDRRAWLNSGSGWREDTAWKPPLCFGNREGVDFGARFLDLNGDGLTDILYGRDTNSCSGDDRKAWLNTGYGWLENDSWEPPLCYSNREGVDFGARFLDLNGDGLPDVLYGRDLNSCSGDDRKAWLNTGYGWLENDSWEPPLCYTNREGVDFGARFLDLNGDGLPDVLYGRDTNSCSSEDRKAWINKAQKSYLLHNITNEFGSTFTVDYKPSTYLNNTGNDTLSDLGFNVWVVANVSEDNDLNGNHGLFSITTYNYSGGMYDYKDREFRGFSYAEERKNDSVVKHWFYQDDARKGNEYRTQTVNRSDSTYQITEREFNTREKGGYFIVTLNSSKEFMYDGYANNPKITDAFFTYDDYGNILQQFNKGEVSVSGDETYQQFTYLYDTEQWILDKPLSVTLLDDALTKVRQVNYSYNTYGDVIKEEHWLESKNNPTIQYTYDSYGNLITETDANGHTTYYGYDVSHTFIINTTNAKGQVATYAYYPGTGNLLWKEDPNHYKITYTYDVFGRLVTEIQPYDSDSSPTRRYRYDIDGVAPEMIMVNTKENGTSTYDTYQYYDGMGRLIQVKSESQGSDFITKDLYYDESFRIENESNPYYTLSSEYSLPKEEINKSKYRYDALSRTTGIKKPDNKEINTIYNRWNISIRDENNRQRDYLKDAYGNIVKVIEYNQNETYTTTYQYNDAGDLLKITDNEGNTIEYIYDSLGRKIKMIDPDLGIWEYGYDPNGNLINQTDNEGNIVRIAYDQLGRIITRQTSEGTTRYYYDEETTGTLSRVIAPSFSLHYYYDNRLRTTKEEKTIEGIGFVIEWYYDSMNRVILEMLPRGKTISYLYDTQGKLDQIPDVVEINYNALSQPTERNYENSLVTQLQYYPENYRIQGITTGTKQDLHYTYDNIGNVITINDRKNDNIKNFTYDWLDRLIGASTSNLHNKEYSITYDYDSIGNIETIHLDSQNDDYLEQYTLNFSYGMNPVHAPSGVRFYYPNRHIPELFVPNQVFFEDFGTGQINLQDYSRDSDGDLLTFSLLEESPTTVDCTLVDTTLILTSNPNWNGLTSCTLLADDGRLGKTNQTIMINVTPVNDVPVLAVPPQTMNEDAGTSWLNLDIFASDIEHDPLLFRVIDERPAEVECTIVGSTLSYRPSLNWNGQTSCLLEVDDGKNKSQDVFQITVLPVNDPPTLALPTKIIDEDSGLSTLDLTLYADDVDGDPLLFMLTKENRSAVDCAVYGNMFSYQPVLNWYGTSTCDVTVDDNHGGIAQDTMMVTVLPINDAPFLSLIPPLTVSEGNILFQPLYAFDVEKDPLYYNINDSRFSLNGTMLKYTTQEGDADNFTLRVSVDDGMNTTIQNVPVIVQPYNGTITTFVGGGTEKIITYQLPGTEQTYVRIKKNIIITNASLILKGFD